MADITMQVEAYGGSDIRNVIGEMVELANRVGIGVSSRLNSVHVTALPGCDPSELYNAWDAELMSDHQYKFVCGRPQSVSKQ